MARSFVQLKYRQRKYKLNPEDIGRVYKIAKRRSPQIPFFQCSPKNLPETDDDNEVAITISQ